MSPADPNIAGQATNQQPARQPLSRAREAITMTRPRPGRRRPSPASTPPRALAILGLLLLSLFTSARAGRGDVPPTLDPAGGSSPDLAGPAPVPLLAEPGPAGTRLALLDVAPALASLPARLRPAPDAPLEPAALVS